MKCIGSGLYWCFITIYRDDYRKRERDSLESPHKQMKHSNSASVHSNWGDVLSLGLENDPLLHRAALIHKLPFLLCTMLVIHWNKNMFSLDVWNETYFYSLNYSTLFIIIVVIKSYFTRIQKKTKQGKDTEASSRNTITFLIRVSKTPTKDNQPWIIPINI